MLNIPIYTFLTKDKGRGLCVFHEGEVYAVNLGKRFGRRIKTGTYVTKRVTEIVCCARVAYVYTDRLHWEDYNGND